MAYSVKCPNCMKPFRLNEQQFNVQLVCPECNTRFRVKSPVHKAATGQGARSGVPAGRKSQPETAAPLPLDDESEGTLLGRLQAPAPLPPPPPLPRRKGPPAPPPRRASSSPPQLPSKQSGGGKRVLIAIVVLLLLGGTGVGGWFGYQRWFAKKDDPAKPSQQTSNSSKYGGIEIGSSGVKMVSVEFHTTDNGTEPSVLEKDTVNTDLADLDEKTNNFDPRRLERTVSNVKLYYDLFIKAGVPPENVHIMSSSGLLSKVDDKSVVERNLAVLKNEIKSKVGKDLEIIDASQEARFSLMAIVPKKDWGETLLMDVGSGNTKGGGFEGKAFIDISVKYGAKSYSKLISKLKGPTEPFMDAVQRLTAEQIADPLRKEVQQTRSLQNRKKVQLLGGAVWAATTFTHPEKHPEQRPELTSADIKHFWDLLRIEDPKERRKTILAKLKSADEKLIAEVEKEVDTIQKVFKQEDLLAGAQILLAIDREFQLDGKKIEFFRLGQYAWLLGYVVDKSGQLN